VKAKKTTVRTSPMKRKATPKYNDDHSDDEPESPASDVDNISEDGKQKTPLKKIVKARGRPSKSSTPGKRGRPSKKGKAAPKSANNDVAESESEVEAKKTNNTPKSPKVGKGKRKAATPKPKASKKAKSDSEDEDDGKEYEIDRILDVHFKKDGKREFEIKWKGYSREKATWEPEENLGCPDVIEAFMSKLEQLKDRIPREVRVERKQTQRYFDSSRNAGVRSSRRNSQRPRTTYHGLDD